MNREQEDVCPVVTVRGDTWDEYLATLDKTARHEIRRKLRRAQSIGELTLEISPPTPEAIDEFIRLHVLRFGEEGLFPNNEGGRRSRHFIRRLAELELSEPDGGQMHVALMRCGGKLVLVSLRSMTVKPASCTTAAVTLKRAPSRPASPALRCIS